MRILYFNLGGSKLETSIYKKINGQINGLRSNGVDCVGFFFNPFIKVRESYKDHISFIPVHNPRKRFFNNLYLQNEYIRAMEKVLLKEEFDYIYLRFPFAHRKLLNLIRQFPKKFIIEYNSLAKEELVGEEKHKSKERFSISLLLSKLQDYYIPLWRLKRFNTKIAKEALVCVSVIEQVANFYALKTGRTLRIGNGITTQNLTPRKPKGLNDAKIIFLILDGTSTPSPWQGLDRLIKSVIFHQLEEKVEIRIAGKTQSKLTESYIKQLGFLNPKEIAKEIEHAHVGTGNLCVFRKGLTEGSNLKVREYVAQGIPILYAMDDIDLDTTLLKNYCFKLPNDNSIIDLPKVIKWIQVLYKQHPNHPTEMHQLAVEHLDFKIKTKQLVDYLNEHA